MLDQRTGGGDHWDNLVSQGRRAIRRLGAAHLFIDNNIHFIYIKLVRSDSHLCELEKRSKLGIDPNLAFLSECQATIDGVIYLGATVKSLNDTLSAIKGELGLVRGDPLLVLRVLVLTYIVWAIIDKSESVDPRLKTAIRSVEVDASDMVEVFRELGSETERRAAFEERVKNELDSLLEEGPSKLEEGPLKEVFRGLRIYLGDLIRATVLRRIRAEAEAAGSDTRREPVPQAGMQGPNERGRLEVFEEGLPPELLSLEAWRQVTENRELARELDQRLETEVSHMVKKEALVRVWNRIKARTEKMIQSIDPRLATEGQ